MTLEARIAFLLLFILSWCFLGLIAWAIVAVFHRGRGALLALPLGLAAATAGGFLLPLIGLRDATGFFLSFPLAILAGGLASFAGVRLADRLGASRPHGPLREPPPKES